MERDPRPTQPSTCFNKSCWEREIGATVSVPGRVWLAPVEAVVVHQRLPGTAMSSNGDQSENPILGERVCKILG